MNYTSTNSSVIQEHYHFQNDMIKFINQTSFQQIATCMDLNGTYTLEFIFTKLKYAASTPKKAIEEFLTRVNRIPSAHSFYQLILTNYTSSFVAYCSSYPTLLSTVGYQSFLIDLVATSINLTSEEFGIFTERMQITGSVRNFSIANWTGIGEQEASIVISNDIYQYYNGMNLSSISTKFNKSKEEIMNMTLIDISVQYSNTSTMFLKGIFKIALISHQITNIITDLTLAKLQIDLSRSVTNESMNVLLINIEQTGKSATFAGELPLITGLAASGIFGSTVLLNQTLMELLVEATRVSEEFVISWFDMSPDMLLYLKKYELSKFFLINFPSMQSRQLLNIPILKLANKSLVEGTKEEVRDRLETVFLDGMKSVMGMVPLNNFQRIYSIANRSIVNLPLAEVLSVATGLDIDKMEKMFPRYAFTLMRSLSMMHLVSQGFVSDSIKLFQLPNSLIPTTKDLRKFFFILFIPLLTLLNLISLPIT